tara:strand:+ start:405 stop:560 length:156 start_codon:yes stop_codon:yes gene_type:complete
MIKMTDQELKEYIIKTKEKAEAELEQGGLSTSEIHAKEEIISGAIIALSGL